MKTVVAPRVLFLGDHFGYPNGVAHGVTVYYLNVLPALVAAGVEVSACFLREPHPIAEQLRPAGIDPTFLSAHPANPMVLSRVAQLVRDGGCQIIHATGLKASLVGRVVARMTGAQAIIHVHDLIYPRRGVGALHRAVARKQDFSLCVSRAAQQVAESGYRVRPDRMRVLHNGIRLDRIRNLPADTGARMRQSLGVPWGVPVLAMVGRMYPIKGHRAMMQMMPAIAAACPDAHLLLAGDGPERTVCERMVRDAGLTNNVHFLGHRHDVPELLAASDLVLMPSLSEGLGLAAVEAMAAGKPVVAFDSGGLRDVVLHGNTGRLVPLGDQAAFVRSVLLLLQNGEQRQIYGQRAIQSADRFSLDRHIDALLDCYMDLAPGAYSLTPHVAHS